MSAIPEQHWRFEIGRRFDDRMVFLNNEPWGPVVWFKVECEASGMPSVTLKVIPHSVIVDINPSEQGEVADGLFGKRGHRGNTPE